MDVVGYTHVLSAAPGDDVRVMVSCRQPEFRADLIRLIHGDPHPDGPGFKALALASDIEGTYPGRHQTLRTGSHIAIETLAVPPSFCVTVWLWATSVGRGRQGVLGHPTWRERGIAVLLEEDGRIALRVNGREVVRSEGPPVSERTWYLVTVGVNAGGGGACIGLGESQRRMRLARAAMPAARGDAAVGPFWLGAADPAAHFNGKLEAPTLFGRPLSEQELERLRVDDVRPEALGGVLAHWDFSRGLSTRRVADISGGAHDGRLVNFPTRAVTGRRWSGREVDSRLAPEEYAAIHFHDDDLDDAGWEPAMTWTVPDGLPSGVYGIRLSSGATQDIVPVFVRPPRNTATSSVGLLLPTFSYLAYANQHVRSEPLWEEAYRRLGSTVEYPVEPQDHYILRESLHSLYDRHADGAGVCYASWLRPLVTMRPDYRQSDVSLTGLAAHQLCADLHLVDWLYEQGCEVDVLTDGDLHAEGVDLLRPYRVTITGTHPEYPSWRMLDALESYVHGGGRIMYLGGNGFYWVTGVDAEEGHTIEVRRWGAATRIWDAAPGEWYLSTTGTLGGLWRYRGRYPQRVFGVGFTAQGVGGSRGYRRTPASYEERYRFVFNGLEELEEIGHEPALVNESGAAGFEIDRFDPELGSPPTTAVLATATGFGDTYQHVIDDQLESDSEQGGTVHPDVRADMVLVEHENGGAVFSPGSITWCSCLSQNGYQNTVSVVTRNVLSRFMDDAVFGAAPPEPPD